MPDWLRTNNVADNLRHAMTTLAHHLHARHVDADTFARQNPYPFLVFLWDSIPVRAAKEFATKTYVGGGDVMRNMAELRAEGKKVLVDHIDETLVFPVVKTGANVYATRITVGRTRTADIMLPDDRISKLHAYIEIQGDNHTLSDAGSKNGTKLNHAVVAQNAGLPLKSGDFIDFAGLVAEFLGAREFHARIRVAVG
jgi:hypothetical protein